MQTPLQAQEIDVDSVRVFISRARPTAEFQAMKGSMEAVGLKLPIQVRDLGRKDSSGCRYELICGQGRVTAAKELGWKKIPALIVEAEAGEIAGRFLSENMLRKSLPWNQKGRMLKEELDAGASVEDAAAKFHISIAHAQKYLRVISKTAQGLEDDVAAMNMADADMFTTLPAEGQKIVMQVVKETGVHVSEVTAKAKSLGDLSELSKSALQASLQAVDGELEKLRKRLKVLRLHHALGPVNVASLLRKKSIRDALAKAGANIARFEEVAEL